MSGKAVAALSGRIIALNVAYVKLAGSLAGGLMLSQAAYWQTRCPDTRDGWWWKTADEWEEETTIKVDQQQSIRKRLVALGVLQEERRGVPGKMWFRVDFDRIAELLCADEEHPDNRDLTAENGSQSVADPMCGRSRTESITKTTPETSKKELTREQEGRFAEFWAIYPRKEAKGTAERAWKAAIRKSPAAEILEAIAWRAARWKEDGTDRTYIPHPATWLNGERWRDQRESAPTRKREDYINWL